MSDYQKDTQNLIGHIKTLMPVWQSLEVELAKLNMLAIIADELHTSNLIQKRLLELMEGKLNEQTPEG